MELYLKFASCASANMSWRAEEQELLEFQCVMWNAKLLKFADTNFNFEYKSIKS